MNLNEGIDWTVTQRSLMLEKKKNYTAQSRKVENALKEAGLDRSLRACLSAELRVTGSGEELRLTDSSSG